ncbi:MAG: DUF4886 domain-containing protein [Ruminococcaceae bacterium]|nr:DUF4886 domain-containing protein [Oscillospiraceae bacterium]
MRILSIGNSYSQDAHRYLHRLSVVAGETISTVNLYIGGCSLERHDQNLQTGEKAYLYIYNGEDTGLSVSLQDAVEHCTYDVVTLQQASHYSTDYSTYQPYLNRLFEYVKLHQPNARILIHETWAYEDKCQRMVDKFGYDSAERMYSGLHDAYTRAAVELGVELIPGGTAMQLAVRNGLTPIHRDTYHASLDYGRYLLAATWYMKLTGKRLDGVLLPSFDTDSPIDSDFYRIATRAAMEAVFGTR